MKSIALFSLIPAAALASVPVLGLTAAFAVFAVAGILGFAITDYSRRYRPLASARARGTLLFATARASSLRLAA